MEVEIVFAGICSFINVENDDESNLEPSVILLRANKDTLGPHGPIPPIEPPTPPPEEAGVHDHNHIPYIAFDSRLASVESEEDFAPVERAPSFLFLPIEGVELKIQGHDIGVPILDPTFHNVISREMYWPESKGLWNRNVVPLRGGQPKKTAVAALMRFADGKLSGGRLCPFKWKFTKLNGETISRHFAEEVIYSYSDTEAEAVVIKLLDLENPNDADNQEVVQQKLTFRPKFGRAKVTLFIGNSIQADMDTAVRRQRSKKPSELKIVTDKHFKFFNAVVDVGELPVPELPTAVLPTANATGNVGGGTDGGICGPKHG